MRETRLDRSDRPFFPGNDPYASDEATSRRLRLNPHFSLQPVSERHRQRLHAALQGLFRERLIGRGWDIVEVACTFMDLPPNVATPLIRSG